MDILTLAYRAIKPNLILTDITVHQLLDFTVQYIGLSRPNLKQCNTNHIGLT
jgi:hypothetical protein